MKKTVITVIRVIVIVGVLGLLTYGGFLGTQSGLARTHN